MSQNILELSDSYKYSQPWQYPSDMVEMFSYGEARSGKEYPATVFFGLQYLINKYLSKPFTAQNILDAHHHASKHGIPFNRSGWTYILKEHKGFIPVEIKSVDEGTLVPTGNVLFTIESTDPKVPWVVGFLETLLLKVWYGSNIATRSYYVKKVIKKYWDKTVDEKNHFGLNFSYHNFGDRGSSSVESAAIGGVAHLTQFLGTDNFNSIAYAERYYYELPAGFSIPATEHSSVTSWGKSYEMDMIMNHIEINKGEDVIACVADSYDYYATVEALTTGSFKEKIESDKYSKFIIRPDSGDAVNIVWETLKIMMKNQVKYITNDKGYKEFINYGILWGDGIDENRIKMLLWLLEKEGFAASNIAFGSGGWLMQQHDRDTQGWAVKCSRITLKDGSTRDVFKDPVTDPGKKSKKGKLSLFYNSKSKDYKTDKFDRQFESIHVTDTLITRYRKGRMMNVMSLREIRKKTI